MQPKLAGRHALVSGGSRGIGRAVAAALTAAGASVTVLGRGEAALIETVAAGDAAHFVSADATDEFQCRSAVVSAEQQAGPVDILVANAGGAESAPFARTSEAMFRRMVDLNLMSLVHLSHAVLEGMLARRFGRIVSVASLAGLQGYAYVTAYCAAKHAAVGFVRSLAAECAGTGVTVNAVCPGYTDTALVAASLETIMNKTGLGREAALEGMLAPGGQKRLLAPEEVAAAVLDFCRPDKNAVSGEVLPLEGRT